MEACTRAAAVGCSFYGGQLPWCAHRSCACNTEQTKNYASAQLRILNLSTCVWQLRQFARLLKVRWCYDKSSLKTHAIL
jgi:hypothetical protein